MFQNNPCGFFYIHFAKKSCVKFLAIVIKKTIVQRVDTEEILF